MKYEKYIPKPTDVCTFGPKHVYVQPVSGGVTCTNCKKWITEQSLTPNWVRLSTEDWD